MTQHQLPRSLKFFLYMGCLKVQSELESKAAFGENTHFPTFPQKNSVFFSLSLLQRFSSSFSGVTAKEKAQHHTVLSSWQKHFELQNESFPTDATKPVS